MCAAIQRRTYFPNIQKDSHFFTNDRCRVREALFLGTKARVAALLVRQVQYRHISSAAASRCKVDMHITISTMFRLGLLSLFLLGSCANLLGEQDRKNPPKELLQYIREATGL